MRILWTANAVWCSSGYGIQGRYLLPRLIDAGHEFGMFAWYGLQGGMQNLVMETPQGRAQPVPVYPQWIDVYGNDIIEAHAEHYKADVVVTLMDAWVLKEYGKRKMRWMPYMPIDMETSDQKPAPPVLKALEGAYRVISYARYGERILNNANVPNVYIPHGVDTNAFAPRDKREAKRNMQIDPDAFLIGMVAANKGFPSRKGFPEQLSAVAAFKQRHKNVKLYLHTLESTQHGGVDFDWLLKDLGFCKEEVIFANQYQYVLGLSEEYMVNAYNAMDVYLGAAMSEGFGIPLIEAQACGVPVITTDATSMTELTFSGMAVPPAQRWLAGLGGWVAIPSVDGIVEALEWAWDHAADAEVKQAARVGALAYDWDGIVNKYWVPFLQEVEAEFQAKPEKVVHSVLRSKA